MKKNILIVDDDVELAELVKEYLGSHNFSVEAAFDAESSLRIIRERTPDLVILDIMLPKKNGFETCSEIRSFSQVPIIMLTARGELNDRVFGLEVGADDYLPKPFDPRELVARIHTVLRRSQGHLQERTKLNLQFGSLKINLSNRSVELGGELLPLTTAEYEVLYFFSKSPQQIFNRDQIYEHLRGTECVVFSRSVDIIISRLRQKLRDDPKHPRFFKTIWGTGYMFIGDAPAMPKETESSPIPQTDHQ